RTIIHVNKAHQLVFEWRAGLVVAEIDLVARIDGIQCPICGPHPVMPAQVKRIEYIKAVLIRAQAEAVAQRRWAEERQYQIRPAIDAVMAQSLAEVFVILLQAQPARRVEQAADAERGVDDEERQGGQGRFWLEL